MNADRYASAALFLVVSIASPAAAVDLEATALEVTQANQSLDNHVRLVAKKGTWVRVHAKSSGAQVPDVVTRIIATRVAPGPVTFLGHIDSKPTTVIAGPNRTSLHNSFNVPLPYHWRSGTVHLFAIVDFADDIAEDDEDNNILFEPVTFEDVPPIRVRAFGVDFPGGTLPAQTHYDHIASWLRRAFPTSALQFEQTTLSTGVNWANAACSCVKDDDGNCVDNGGQCINFLPRDCDSDADCGCGWLNEILMARRADDAKVDGFQPDTRYVALVDDGGGAGFMRGCSPGLGAKVAAGPVGIDVFEWDTDGSYADFYTAHELGHTYGRAHAGCCGAPDPDPSFPYPTCDIGDDDQAGFDTQGPRSYPNEFSDVMSYCNFQWTSDYTFEGIMDQLIAEKGAPLPPIGFYNDLAIVAGNVNLSLARGDLTSVLRLPPGRARVAMPGGDWEIRFLDDSGATLSRYFFTPHEIADDHDLVPPSIQDGHVRDVVGVFAEMVPVPPGPVARLALLHMGVEKDSRSASANAPTVTILSPNGGETIDGATSVQWMAADLDGDSLTFKVLYTADAGANWKILASDLTAATVDVDLTGLPGSDSVLFRVIASDGFHTASDDSDATLTVTNALPHVYIIEPGDGTGIEAGQSAIFEGQANDAEDGGLDGESLVWSSDRQGTLGTGASILLAAELVPGTHTITLTATDANGGSAGTSVTIVKGSAAADACPAYPRADCDSSDGASLSLTNRGGKRRMLFRFPRGDVARAGSDFGTPTASTTHTLCLYEAGRLRDALEIAPSASAWTAIGTRGFRYANPASDVVVAATLRAGSPARPAAARVSVRGAGAQLPAMRVPLELPVTVQLVNDATTACFGADLGPGAVRKNQRGSFQAR